VSGLARLLASQVGGSLGAVDGVREDRVTALREQIDGSAYQVDDPEVARAFLGDVLAG
jgi:anti-sigma28 factor (negative regulator of flagellin synthesis)